MTAADFRRQFASYLGLLAYARRTNDLGGVARCERELNRLAEAGATTPEETTMTTDDPTGVLLNPTPPPLPRAPAAFDGLTVRDYFAAAALQGVLAAHAGDEISMPDPKQAARWGREYADALLAELGDHTFC